MPSMPEAWGGKLACRCRRRLTAWTQPRRSPPRRPRPSSRADRTRALIGRVGAQGSGLVKRFIFGLIVAGSLAYGSVAYGAASQITITDDLFTPRAPAVRNVAAGASCHWATAAS